MYMYMYVYIALVQASRMSKLEADKSETQHTSLHQKEATEKFKVYMNSNDSGLKK